MAIETPELTKPVIELKNIKVHLGLSQETYAYTATIYVDGKRWGTTENAGHGGSDLVSPLKGRWDTIKELNDRIKATYENLPSDYFEEGHEPDLEILCHDLVGDYLFARDIKKDLRKKVMAIAPEGAVVTFSLQPTEENLARFKAQRPTYTVINDRPVKEIMKLIRDQEDQDDKKG